tara:strand:- start:212 stop:913 length:702 start_codon:yes stop_codon:yes gene_type:complete
MSYIGIKPASTGSVGTNQIVDTAVTGAKFNADVISSQTALATEPADTDEFLVSDAGVLKRLDYSIIKGGGKVLQVIQNWDDDYATYSNTSVDAQATVLSQAITPSATSSKILIQVNLCVSVQGSNHKHYGLVMYRGSSVIANGDKSTWQSGVGETHSATAAHSYSQPDKILTGLYLDSPNTTSATTYNIKSFIHDYGSSISAQTLVVNGGGYNYNSKETAITSSSLTLWEIGA